MESGYFRQQGYLPPPRVTHAANEAAQTAPVPPAPAETDSAMLAGYNFAARPADRNIVQPHPALVAEDPPTPMILPDLCCARKDVGARAWRQVVVAERAPVESLLAVFSPVACTEAETVDYVLGECSDIFRIWEPRICMFLRGRVAEALVKSELAQHGKRQ